MINLSVLSISVMMKEKLGKKGAIIEENTSTKGWVEQGIVEIRPGHLLMYGRTQGGKQFFSFSNDNGFSWSTPQKSNLSSPEAPVKIINISNMLLAVHIDNSKDQTRRPLSISVSYDQGKTWFLKHVIANDKAYRFAYPSIIQDGMYLYVTYWVQSGVSFSLAFEKFRLDEILNKMQYSY